MVGIVHRTVVLLDIRHQVVDQVLAEHVLAKAHRFGQRLRKLLRCLPRHRRGCLWNFQLIGVTVWQHDDHLLRSLLGQQVVEDVIDASHLIVHLLGIRRSTDQVEHGIFLLHISYVVGRKDDDSIIGGTKTLGVIVHILYASMRHILDVVRQGTRLGRNLQQAVLKALVGEILWILRVHHTHAVHDEAVRIHVWSRRTYRHCPHT